MSEYLEVKKWCMGILVLVKGINLEKIIGYCIDIDVLLIIEEIGLFFVLKYFGNMYVCGYDLYMSIVFGVLMYFVSKLVKDNLFFVF